MNIVVCGSMIAAKAMVEANKILEAQGHTCVLPSNVKKYASGDISSGNGVEGAKRKSEGDLVRGYYQQIKNGDIILVVNSVSRHGVNYYIGGNTFWELGFAHIEGKPVILMQPPDSDQWYFYQELIYLKPFILYGDLSEMREWQDVNMNVQQADNDGTYRCSNDSRPILRKVGQPMFPCSCGKGHWRLTAMR